MTRNQIELSNFRETQHHNRVMEAQGAEINAETNRSNLARERENNRSNLANEALKKESNIINENHFLRQDYETNRSNLANEAIRRDANIINATHYQRLDAESVRHNKAQEGLSAQTNAINNSKLGTDYKLGIISNQLKAEQNQINRELANSQVLNDFMNRNLISEKISSEGYNRDNTQAKTDLYKEQAVTEKVNRPIPWVSQFNNAVGNVIKSVDGITRNVSKVGGVFQ